MDEEELEQPKKKKITLSNFFESIVKIDKLANRALSTANSNLNIIQDQKLLIESLSMSLEGLKSDVQQINNYIIVERKIEKDAEADLRLEEEDKEQKQMMAERLKGDKGEDGDKGEGGDQGDTGDTGDTGKAPPQPVESKGFLGSALGALAPLLGGVGLQFLAPILGGAFTGLKTGGPIGALIGGPLGGALEFSGLGKSLTGDAPKPKTNFFETINPFARLGGMFGRKFGKKDEGVEGGKNQVKEEIKSEIKEELNLTSGRGESIEPEKKGNFITNFFDKIRDFDGRPGSRKTKGKNEFYDKDGNYIGNNERKLQFQEKKDDLKRKTDQLEMETTIGPDGSITSKGSGTFLGGELYKPGEKMSLKQRLSIQARIQMQGEDTVKPEMLKDFYNSGGPLSKEESAEYMKSENIEAGAFTDDDLVQPDEKRGVKEIIGGVADTLTGGVFDFDKKGNNKLQDFQQGVMKTVTDNTFGKMKRLYNEDRKTPELKLSGEAERLIGDDKPFLDEVQRVSEKYEINPADLVGLMASESSLDPAADNGTHVGLIQFSADRAEELGTTQEELVKMSRAQQMKFVEKYFDIVKLPKGASKGELYTSVFMPEYTDRGTDFELSTKFDKFSDGEPGNPSVYAANQGLDADEDGFITIEEMGSRITSKQDEFGISSEKESKPEGLMRILTGIADRVTGEKFDFDQRGDIIPKLENDTAELSGNVLAPPDDSYPKLSAGVIQTLNETALTGNPSPLVQAEAPQVSEAEIKSTETTSSFIKTISNDTIASSRKSKFGLPPEIMRMIT